MFRRLVHGYPSRPVSASEDSGRESEGETRTVLISFWVRVDSATASLPPYTSHIAISYLCAIGALRGRESAVCYVSTHAFVINSLIVRKMVGVLIIEWLENKVGGTFSTIES